MSDKWVITGVKEDGDSNWVRLAPTNVKTAPKLKVSDTLEKQKED